MHHFQMFMHHISSFLIFGALGRGTRLCVFLQKKLLVSVIQAGLRWGAIRKRILWSTPVLIVERTGKKRRDALPTNIILPMVSCRICKGKWRHATPAGIRCESLL